jgi:ribosome maturation factor RimP
MATGQYNKEGQLYREVSHTISAALPDVEVLALELTGREGFRVYVDHAAGVDHALCERVSTVLRRYLDEYSVEVSSPGFERPLRTREHFERAVGRRVRLKTTERRLRARVVSASERTVRLEDASGSAVDVPYEEIVRANLIDEGQGA